MIKNYSAQTRVHKESFSRAQARKEAPSYILERYETLWQEIDTLDLMINYYDLAHGKRKNPRGPLLNLFTPEEQEKLKEKASHPPILLPSKTSLTG